MQYSAGDGEGRNAKGAKGRKPPGLLLLGDLQESMAQPMKGLSTTLSFSETLTPNTEKRQVLCFTRPFVQPILTLDARDNIMLEVMRDYFTLSDPQVHREIQAMHLIVQEILAEKGVSYPKLRSALVPSVDRHEAAFIFNSQKIGSSWYGYKFAEAVIPKLDCRSSHSVLCGDLIHENQELMFELLQESLLLAKSFEFVHSSLLYCIYINNLSGVMLKNLHEGLTDFEPYVGFIPATFSSRAKTYLSATLVPCFLKSNSRIIMGHEDDLPNEENVNTAGFPFEENGYKCLSLQSSYFDVFLSYKTERAVFSGFERDTDFALNAVTDMVLPLSSFEVLIEESKLKYLRTDKAGKLKKACLAEMDEMQLSELIKSKILANYVYNLVYLEDHGVVKFNLMIEVGGSLNELPTKIMVALEYQPTNKILRVITLY
ncbi:MAG: hypothetical protein Q7N50_03670 [Armatimonadota bacterium]|nr:hypothetical protein [Armatimonadota bacterium]